MLPQFCLWRTAFRPKLGCEHFASFSFSIYAACSLPLIGVDASAIAIENGKLSARRSIRKEHNVICWLGVLRTLAKKRHQPNKYHWGMQCTMCQKGRDRWSKKVGAAPATGLPGLRSGFDFEARTVTVSWAMVLPSGRMHSRTTGCNWAMLLEGFRQHGPSGSQ